ncbi:DUF72 domain-containing protein [Massilia atriviolacea]|uniref:DUF72 domain-containing protein n=1 Tax=Massilia atriviolacea TaxID=2495579 RepID=A0A430HCN2_9BURK|nr:DUF72 domain-containing protein [Massilia atriviolacea]RSZ55285.1 DUF72 domain-containing protein [Massilia atriviolacea]
MRTEPLQAPGVLRIGCAGWAISREAAAAFDTEGSHLERYARVLGTVEINSSFYRPHQAKTYARWAASVPPAFRFAVKLPRTITHDAGLAGIDPLLDRFAGEASALGEKLGCLLVQLPSASAFDSAIAGDFFARVSERFGCMVACEARHPSWFGEDATELLRRCGITRVIADPAKGQEGPHVPTTQAIYVRLHGAPRIYYSSYSPDYIAQLARDMAIHARQGRDVWVVFDNTASGAALPNALDLQALMPAPGPGLPA